MKKDVKFIIIPLVLIGVFAAALYYFNNKNQPSIAETQPATPEVKVERPGNYSKGPADAKVTVVEFFDPECEGCAAFHPILQKLIVAYQYLKLVVVYQYLNFK